MSTEIYKQQNRTKSLPSLASLQISNQCEPRKTGIEIQIALETENRVKIREYSFRRGRISEIYTESKKW